jgi:hypothetical protein
MLNDANAAAWEKIVGAAFKRLDQLREAQRTPLMKFRAQMPSASPLASLRVSRTNKPMLRLVHSSD